VTANTQPYNNCPQFLTRLLILVPSKSRLRRQSPKHQQFLLASSHCRYLSLWHVQGCHPHQALHPHPCLHHFQGCQLSPVPRHLQPRPLTHCPNRPPKLTKLAPAMPANGAANNIKPSAPPPSKHPNNTRRMNPQLLVQPLAQYRTQASQENATAPKLPRTLSIKSVPCFPHPHRLIQSPHQSPSPIPPCLPMPFGPPTLLLIPAPAPPWSIPSSSWARTANSGLQPPRVKSVALLKANNQTCPLAATRCTSWITATFLQVAKPRIYASLPPSSCTRSKCTASASPLAATASTTKAKSALPRPT